MLIIDDAMKDVFGAPRLRPAGMDKQVPYEPVLGARRDWSDAVAFEAIKAWYATPLHKLPAHLIDWWRGGRQAPVEGTPGAPRPDAPGAHKVAMLGDIGEASPAQARTAAQLLKWGPTHVGTLGDNVYPTGREIDWRDRFDPIMKDMMRTTRVQPALGNHDYYNADLTPYFKRFPHLEGHAFYTWTKGPAQFFVLDSEQRLDPKSAQYKWLDAELGRSAASYKVVQMHRPAVSSDQGQIGRNLRGSLGPLLAKHAVQLVLAGHEHTYERSNPIAGTVHVVSGGGGASIAPDYLGPMPSTLAVRTPRAHHLEMSYDDDQMVVRAVDDRGGTFDTFTVAPRLRAGVADAAAGAAAVAAARPSDG